MFITFEGPDGSGKSTQIPLLADYLTNQGYSVFQTREPGGTPIGEQIRDVVHSLENQELAPSTEILLYSASRAQLVEEFIRPRLESGSVVISDRFYDSTLAYQGYGHGLDLETLRLITKFATGGLVPDLTFYFDISPEVGLQRRKKDTDAEWNRLDNFAIDFHNRVGNGYMELIKQEPQRWVRIDAEQSVETIHEIICEVAFKRLNATIKG